MKLIGKILAISVLLAGLGTQGALARANFVEDSLKDYGSRKALFTPAHCAAGHRAGQLELTINNNGTLGTGFTSGPRADCFSGLGLPSCSYPKFSHSTYLFAGAFWIGGIVGRDTLVSVGADGWSFVREFFPDESPFGDMIQRSIKDPSSPLAKDAVSEEDYICVYSDTITDGVGNDYFGRPHVPLNIEVTENSYAWSYSYAEDFILFDYQVKNIGRRTLEEVYMGVYIDADVWHGGDASGGAQDDLCGFLYSYPDSCKNCEYLDTVFTAWIADADADWRSEGSSEPVPNVTATRIIRTPQNELNVSFNWWISDAPAQDFGPRRIDNLRDFRTGGLGTPEGDVNKYHVLSNGEFDYDQAYTATISQADSVWLTIAKTKAERFASGEDTRYLLSFGPFEIDPGQTLPISFAYVAGAGFHPTTLQDNYINLPHDPDRYYRNLNFSDLANNSKWASFIYDNPGVDTDGDGYRGEFVTCIQDSTMTGVDTTIVEEVTYECPTPPCTTFADIWEYGLDDTCWIRGDNVPDFRGASPPPAPDFWLEPVDGSIRVRFNGMRSETTPDIFSHEVDFEGYRVWIARDMREQSFALVASYDLENYNKYVLTDRNSDTWELLDIPFTRAELMSLYAYDDSIFTPERHTRQAPYVHPHHVDSVFYFESQDYNASELGVTTPIIKIYPDEEFPPTLDEDTAAMFYPEVLTDDGHFKYFEYELTVDQLLPSVMWYLSVTSFDFGSPESGLAPLESSRTIAADSTYAAADWKAVKAAGDKVYAYPNPYRVDQNYHERGYEGRNPSLERPINRTRAIHFANLPPRCKIRIFTLDGDLVREIEHDVSPSSPLATHDSWNLITRNTQLVVSGLYYWTVEDADGNVQIGKLAVIM